MLFTGSFTIAIEYIMLLCDNVIAGQIIGESGVAAINTIKPITNIVLFFANIVSIGSGILYSRCIGGMNRRRADEIYGQGMILSALLALLGAAFLYFGRDLYFDANGISGELREMAAAYYTWTPLNAVLRVMLAYMNNMVYTDGDEKAVNQSYALQIVGNILASVLLARQYGMTGIILGTVVGNVLGLPPLITHLHTEGNTLQFVPHFSLGDFRDTLRLSSVDSMIYLCWGVADYVLIGHVARHYGRTGQVTLAVVISLIEFSVVLDGVGMAMQPLLSTYLGEGNHTMIRRLMGHARWAAIAEGLAATALLMAFAPQYCALFGIVSGEALASSTYAVRVVCFVGLSMFFCSLISLATSYYMLVDRLALAVGITVLKEGVCYTLLPLLGSALLGMRGIWLALALAPMLALNLGIVYILLRYGLKRFPLLLEDTDDHIEVFEDTLTQEHCARLSRQVEAVMRDRGCSDMATMYAAMFTEEIGLAILERNKPARRPLLMEISLIFDDASVLMIQRDSGEIFDVTDPNQKIKGLSSYVVNALLRSRAETAYLTTTGYNRNMIRIPIHD